MADTMEATKEMIQKTVSENNVVLFMKGNKAQPMCGFSARAVQILNHFGTDYVTHNVLEDENLRQGIKEFSNWPTIPQLYIKGEFVGGSDIMAEMAENGELEKMLG